MTRFIESKHVEYKRELTEALEKEVVAFLNTSEGGHILLGIDARTDEVLGFVDIDAVQLQIKDRLKNNILPSILGLFDVALEEIDVVKVIKVIIAGGAEKPYHIKKLVMSEKGCFIRVGSASEPMSQETIETLFSTRVRNSIGRMLSPRTNLTFEQLKIYYLERGLKLNDAFLPNLELLTPEGKLNYAAYLLADDNGLSIQIAKYADTTRVHLIENRDFGRCSLIKSYKNVMDRMNVENTIFTRIAVPLREERELIKGIAVREAVVNALVHNDYSNGSYPKFEFFSDRLEITSAGGLPYGLAVNDFFAGHSSPRNKEIMRVFRDLEIVEQLGSGIPRIIEAYGKDCFQLSNNFMRLVFPYAEGLVKDNKKEHEGINSGNTQQDGTRLGPSRDQVGAKQGLSKDQVELLLFCENERTIREMMDFAKRSNRTKFRDVMINPLLDRGWLEMTDPDNPTNPNQKYRLTEAGKNIRLIAGEE